MKTILLIGSSKAGFGALLVGGLCARRDRRRVIRVLSFQPSVRIWPYDPHWPIRSYHRLHVRSGKNRARRRNLRRNGDATFVAETPKAIVRVVYPEFNEHDRRQALLLDGPNVSRLPIPSALHNALSFVILAGQPEDRVRVALRRSMTMDEEEEGGDKSIVFETVVEQIVAATHLRSFDALIEEMFALAPAATSASWRVVTIARRIRRLLRRLSASHRDRRAGAAS